MNNFLYLSSEQIATLRIPAAAITGAVEAMFKQKSLGRTLLKPKVNLSPSPGYVVEALAGADLDSHSAAVKWVSVSPENHGHGLPNVQALIILSETRTGTPVAVMNGTWITGVRTAACSAVAAKYLASKQSSSIGFIGAGFQARTHLTAIRDVFPSLSRVTFYSRGSASANEFLSFIHECGLEGERAATPRQAVENQDIVVSSIPPATRTPFLEPAWVSPGAFVSAVDLGRPWTTQGWATTFDVTATDDRQQSEDWGRAGKMLVPGRFDAEIGDLVLGQHPGRSHASQRTALLFAGMGLADLAVASLVAKEAATNGVGTLLPS